MSTAGDHGRDVRGSLSMRFKASSKMRSPVTGSVERLIVQ
jgi:hypothetical protein